MIAELTEERVAALEDEIASCLYNDPDDANEKTTLALIAYWRENEALKAESETVPKLCRHCGMTLPDHRVLGNNCQGDGGWQSSGWRSTVFEPAE